MMRRLTLAFCLALLAACGGPAGQDASPIDGSVRPPAFGDADPTDWPGRGPAALPVHGIDVSRFQGSVDWKAARAAGVSFAFLKATEGGDRVDEAFAANWAAAGRAGVPRGAYHFWYHCKGGAEQAAWFIANVPRSAGALPPVLDLEWTPFSPTCTRRPPGAEIRAEAQVFLDAVERYYGQRPIIYTSPDIYAAADLGQLRGYEFWLRAVARPPATVYPGQAWTFWQYSSTGLVPGSPTQTDLDVFRGSAADWRNWLAARAR